MFKHPSNFYICGPSQSGKTEFVKKLIKELMFDIPPQQIVWCYKEWQTAYSQLQEREKIKFLRGIPDQDEDLVTDTGEPYLLVFDDMIGLLHRNSTVARRVTNDTSEHYGNP